MTGYLGAYADGQDLHGADLNADTATLSANDAAVLLVCTAGWNTLVSGCALTAPGGLVVDVASGQATAAGVVLMISAGSVTCVTNSGQANPRIDVVYAQLLPGGASGTNAGSGNPIKADTYVLGVRQGTNAASPTAPTLPGANYVQLGIVNVPAGATSIAAANLGSQVTAPNAQGPLAPVLVTPMTGAGGTTAFALALTDSNGAVGRANYIFDFDGAYRGAGSPGGTEVLRTAITDAFGAVGAAHTLCDSQGALHRAVWGISTQTYVVSAGQTVSWSAALDDPTFVGTRAQATILGTQPGLLATVSTFSAGHVSGTLLNVTLGTLSGGVMVTAYSE